MDLQKSAQLAAFIHDLTLPGRVSQNFQTHPEETRAGQKVWDICHSIKHHASENADNLAAAGCFSLSLCLPLFLSVRL